VKEFVKDEVKTAINMRRLLKEIFRRVTYDTVFHGPYGPRKIGADIPPFRKIFTHLVYGPEEKKKYIKLATSVAVSLMTTETSNSGRISVLGVVYGSITVADITTIIITYVRTRLNITYVNAYGLK
jgi:hypothetical protein